MLFVTGGTGFIGRRLLAALTASGGHRVRCLTRREGNREDGCIQFVRGDLTDPATYREALRGSAAVIHLAAQTGNASPREHARVNVDGTNALLAACREAGVTRLLFVSSIAATYRNNTAYHYASSKAAAEEAVRASGLRHVIVRPTLVFGRGSPVWKGLAALAALPIMPMFGDGQVRTQPVHVGDLVNVMLARVEHDRFDGRAIAVGGPDVVTIEELLRRIRRALRGRDSRVVRVPAAPAITLLARLEPWLRPILPVTAGQLSLFVNDSTAGTDAPPPGAPPPEAPPQMTLDEMIRVSASDDR